MKTKFFGGVLLLFGSIFLFTHFAWGENTDIIFNEIGAYESSGHEWLEIFNKGEDPIDLTDWKFWEAETNHGLELVQGDDWIIEPGEHAIITQNDVNFINDYPNVTSTIFDSSWSTLNEGGEEIGLKDTDGNFVEQFTYVEAKDYSLERKNPEIPDYSETNWLEHLDKNTVGEKNYWHVDEIQEPPENPENQSPKAVIDAPLTVEVNTEVSFDGSSSSDADGTIISYDWDFGDWQTDSGMNVTHTYSTTGTFQITLAIADNGGIVGTASATIEITGQTEEPPEDLSSTEVKILINEFVADPNFDKPEWIELYNASASNVDLTDWTLHDGVGKVAASTSTIEAEGFIVIELNANKLNNGGDLIILKNPEDEIVDAIAYGIWDDGDVSNNAPTHEKENSVARISQDESSVFSETTTPTKGFANQINAPQTEDPPGDESEKPTSTKNYNTGDLVINELVSDPADDEEEFIELYNKTNEEVFLSGWWIEDGSETKTVLTGNISVGGFFVIEKPKGNLNNSGDIVILYDPSGKKIDHVTYGKWDDGNVADNAPAPKDPLSLARKADGLDADNDYYDFIFTSTITKNSNNVISSITEDGEVIEQNEQVAGATNIIINEVFPNPKGSDSDDEFIELKNIGTETINLAKWKLGDSSKKRYIIKQGSIKAGQYLVFKRTMTSIALNNTGGDEVKLFSPSGAIADEMKYPSSEEDQSYARRDDNTWGWTTKLTPNANNVIEGKSAAPIISIDVDTEVAVNEPVLFDASDTTDPDCEEMGFAWNFDDGKEDDGDVVEHRFKKEGVYTITLTVVDSSKNESKKSVIITVKNSADFVGGYLQTDAVERIQISEFVPNPEGSDTTEFIELHNPTSEDIDISGLKLDDEEGGSRAYTIPDNTKILTGSYLVIGRQDSKIALNNTGDSVRLLYPDGTIIKEVRYDDVLEAHSYIQDEEEKWIWSSSITPGKENIISAPKAVAGKKVSRSKSKRVKPVIETTLEKIRDEDIGDRVKVTGVVAVLPGKLASQYFYIVGSPGVQVYMYKKDFPKMSVGDRVEVTGELSQTSGEARLKTSQKSDIKIIDHAGEPQPKDVEVADIGEPLEGWLAKINGEITEIKSSYMYVDDGTEEVKVYFKRGTGIDKKLLQLGDLVSVTGIINQTKSGFQLLPRSQADIMKTGVADTAVEHFEQLEEENEKEVAEKYLTATAGGLTSVLVGLFAHSRGPTLWKRGREKFLKIVKKK